MNTPNTLNLDAFAVALTAEERDLLTNGRGPRVRHRDDLTGERLFSTMAGKRSYRSQRGTYRTFA